MNTIEAIGKAKNEAALGGISVDDNNDTQQTTVDPFEFESESETISETETETETKRRKRDTAEILNDANGYSDVAGYSPNDVYTDDKQRHFKYSPSFHSNQENDVHRVKRQASMWSFHYSLFCLLVYRKFSYYHTTKKWPSCIWYAHTLPCKNIEMTIYNHHEDLHFFGTLY